MMKSYRITVRGKVQGVFFRKYTREKALELNLSGFVKNVNDGSVYAEISGDTKAAHEFIKWCLSGSPQAKVRGIEVEEMESSPFTGSFDIRS